MRRRQKEIPRRSKVINGSNLQDKMLMRGTYPCPKARPPFPDFSASGDREMKKRFNNARQPTGSA